MPAWSNWTIFSLQTGLEPSERSAYLASWRLSRLATTRPTGPIYPSPTSLPYRVTGAGSLPGLVATQPVGHHPHLGVQTDDGRLHVLQAGTQGTSGKHYSEVAFAEWDVALSFYSIFTLLLLYFFREAVCLKCNFLIVPCMQCKYVHQKTVCFFTTHSLALTVWRFFEQGTLKKPSPEIIRV